MFLHRFYSGDVSQSPPSLLTLVQDMDVELVGLSQESGMLISTLSDSRIRAKVVESIITHSTAKLPHQSWLVISRKKYFFVKFLIAKMISLQLFITKF